MIFQSDTLKYHDKSKYDFANVRKVFIKTNWITRT